MDILVPSLPRKLDKSGLKKAIDTAYRVMFEEGNSVPQLAHVWSIVVKHPAIFYNRRTQLARYMINSLNRLGLPPNSSPENRVLAVSIVDLVMEWDKDQGNIGPMESQDKALETNRSEDDMDIDIPSNSPAGDKNNAVAEESSQSDSVDSSLHLDKSSTETILNFLIRLKILLADPKVDTNTVDVQPKLDELLRETLCRWKGSIIRPAYFERVVSMCNDDDCLSVSAINARAKGKGKGGKGISKIEPKGSKATAQKDDEAKKMSQGLVGILSACLEIFTMVAEEDPENIFLTENPNQLKSILSACFRHSSLPEEVKIRMDLQNFLVSYLSLASPNGTLVDERVAQPVAVWLERMLHDAEMECRRTPSQNPTDSSRNSRLRPSQPEDGRAEDSSALFALGVIRKIGNVSPFFTKTFTSSLISLLGAIVKKHTLQAAAKQKQNGVSYNPQVGTISIRQMYPTPVSGIIEESSSAVNGSLIAGASRSSQAKQPFPSKELQEFDCMLRSAVVILNILGMSDLAYLFTPQRKSLLSLLQSILDMSNSVQLLLASVQMVGEWLIAGNSGPLTVKERTSFLWKISSYDFNGLSEVVAQPLCDLVCHYMRAVASVGGSMNNDSDEIVTSRSLVSCLLTANTQARKEMLTLFQKSDDNEQSQPREPEDILWQFLHGDLEGLGGRDWVVVLVDILLENTYCSGENSRSKDTDGDRRPRQQLPSPPLMSMSDSESDSMIEHQSFTGTFLMEEEDLNSNGAMRLLSALRLLIHADPLLCKRLLEILLSATWLRISDNSVKLRLVSAMESFLSKPFHSQSFKKESSNIFVHQNAVKSFLSGVIHLDPTPSIDVDLLITLARNYNCWYEVLSILENQFSVLAESNLSETGITARDKILLAMRHCYRELGENNVQNSLALRMAELPGSHHALSLEVYGKLDKALEAYTGLIDLVESEESITATNFEMDFWEERWVFLQQQEQQLAIVSEYANQTHKEDIMLECAWRERDWDKVRSLCASTEIIAAVEAGNPAMKICETLSAVADGKLGDVENLHAQSSQLCLYNWQFLPQLSSGSGAHSKLLHYFHRLVELRESGQIMVETNNHNNGKTLPDLKNLLNAWRHRLPNDEEDLTVWDEIFAWRTTMFNAIISNFSSSEPSMLASLHDRPWTGNLPALRVVYN
jgi:transformation/transcription domain-associated protein